MSRAAAVLAGVLANCDKRRSAAERMSRAGLPTTPEQAANLARLAVHLRSLPEGYREFEMAMYYHGRVNPDEVNHPYQLEEFNLHANKQAGYACGTSACAVGHGPAAGIPMLWVGARPESWLEYQSRAFGPDVYEALFHGSWSNVDNTPHGAAARIAYVLDKPELAVDMTPEFENPTEYEVYLQ